MTDGIEVREARAEDVRFAAAVSRLIELVAEEYDIATRTPSWIAAKICAGQAAVAIDPSSGHEELIGFGTWSAWDDDRFVSHSGLVVHPAYQGHGLGRRLKEVVFESSVRQLPGATLMSLTTSPSVKRMNESLGFRVVPFERMTNDPAFWKGCETCRNFAAMLARGVRCCCEGMIRPPGGWADDEPAGDWPEEPPPEEWADEA